MADTTSPDNPTRGPVSGLNPAAHGGRE